MNKTTLSVCYVVKNEEKYLKKSLTSVKAIADEIIVIDTGSTDKTFNVAKGFTDKVYSIQWEDDFSKARNYALEQASGDWVLMLDGDEELDSTSGQVLLDKIAEDKAEGFLVKVINYYNSGSETLVAPDLIFRLFRNKSSYRYTGAIHENVCDNILAVNPQAKIDILEDIVIIHYGYLQEQIRSKDKANRNSSLLKKAIEQDPSQLLNYFHLGVEYFRTNQLEMALDQFLYVYNRANNLAVYMPKLLRYITSCKHLLGLNQEALEFTEGWEKLFPDHGDLYYLRGVINLTLSNFAAAYFDFTRCLETEQQPAHYATLYSHQKDKIHYQLGTVSEYYMDQEAALDHYIEALKHNPSMLQALTKLIGILKPKDNPQATLDFLQRVFDLSDPSLQIDLGKIFYEEKAYPLALKYFGNIPESAKQSSALQLLEGLAWLRTGDYKQAEQILKLIQPSDDFYTVAQGNLAIYCWVKDNLGQANHHLGNIKAANPNSELLLALRPLFANNKLAEQPNRLQKVALELLPLIIEFGDLGKFQQAWTHFEPHFQEKLHKFLGDAYFQHKFYPQAELEYRSLLKEDPNNPEVNYLLGQTLSMLNNFEESLIYLYKAKQEEYKPPLVTWELAQVYQKLATETLEKKIEADAK